MTLAYTYGEDEAGGYAFSLDYPCIFAEAFNVFDDENFGQPTQLVEPGRRLQFGASYSF